MAPKNPNAASSTPATQAGQAAFAAKVDALKSLRATRNAAEDADLELRLQGKDSEADDVWGKIRVLDAQTDVLSGQLMDDWSKETSSLSTQLFEIRGKLDGAVANIRAQMALAQQVVQVLGLLDDVLAIAVKFLA